MTFGGRGYWTAIGTLDQGIADGLVARALDRRRQFHSIPPTSIPKACRRRSPAAPSPVRGARAPIIVLATKVHGIVGKGRTTAGASRGHIMDGVKKSLKRLNTDYIRPLSDPRLRCDHADRGDGARARYARARRAGALCRVSNWPAWAIMKALGIADRRGLARFSTLQAYYTVAGPRSRTRIGAFDRGREARPYGVEPRSPAASCPANTTATARDRKARAAPLSISRR